MAGTFNQSLQCTQDVFVGFQAPSPPVIASYHVHVDLDCRNYLREITGYQFHISGEDATNVLKGVMTLDRRQDTPPLL